MIHYCYFPIATRAKNQHAVVPATKNIFLL